MPLFCSYFPVTAQFSKTQLGRVPSFQKRKKKQWPKAPNHHNCKESDRVMLGSRRTEDPRRGVVTARFGRKLLLRRMGLPPGPIKKLGNYGAGP